MAYGPIPGPQLVPLSELFAFLVYLRFAMPCNGRYLYVTDCQYVIDGVGKGRAAMTNGWAPHPGIWRDIFDKLADIGTKVVLVKVKSHRSLGSANGASDAFLICGNMLADLLAKKRSRLPSEG